MHSPSPWLFAPMAAAIEARAQALRVLAARVADAARHAKRVLDSMDSERFLGPLFEVVQDAGGTLDAYLASGSLKVRVASTPNHVGMELSLLNALAAATGSPALASPPLECVPPPVVWQRTPGPSGIVERELFFTISAKKEAEQEAVSAAVKKTDEEYHAAVVIQSRVRVCLARELARELWKKKVHEKRKDRMTRMTIRTRRTRRRRRRRQIRQ